MCPSQYVPVLELWEGFNPLGVPEGIFVIFKGYIDESYGNGRNVFALSCLIARGKDWQEIERIWKLHLRAKNKQLEKVGRKKISRYHASDCSSRKGEFKGWSYDERDAFVLGLYQAFKRFPTFTSVYDVQLDEMCEVFPDAEKDRLEAAYGALTKFLLLTIGRDLKKMLSADTNARITLFHDRTADGRYDSVILNSFNWLMNDPTFRYRDIFTTIAPLRWQDSVALQPADLMAFECYKEADARLAARESRKSMKELMRLPYFGIHSMTINKESLLKLKELIDASEARKKAKAV